MVIRENGKAVLKNLNIYFRFTIACGFGTSILPNNNVNKKVIFMLQRNK